MFSDDETGFPLQPDSRVFKVMIVAGEASGDLHGAYLVQAMKAMMPNVSFCGVGGHKMQQAEVTLLANVSDLAVMGLVEVLGRLKSILGVMAVLKRILEADRPHLLILIDYPGFNLKLAKAAKKRGVKVLYYISPKVWAWRKGRVKTIRRTVDHMALIFPFEEDIYRRAGVPATFVGHPLLEEIELRKTIDEIKHEFDLEADKTTVALLPGSREGEVQRILPVMVQAAKILADRFPAIQFVLPVAHTVPPGLISGIFSHAGITVRLVNGRTHEVLTASDVAVVASGTASLETALLVKPMVIVYKVSPLTYFFGKMVVRIRHAGLPNIIAGRTIVPELIQKDFTAQRVADEITLILKDRQVRDRMIQDLIALRKRLGEAGASRRTARLACSMLV